MLPLVDDDPVLYGNLLEPVVWHVRHGGRVARLAAVDLRRHHLLHLLVVDVSGLALPFIVLQTLQVSVLLPMIQQTIAGNDFLLGCLVEIILNRVL